VTGLDGFHEHPAEVACSPVCQVWRLLAQSAAAKDAPSNPDDPARLQARMDGYRAQVLNGREVPRPTSVDCSEPSRCQWAPFIDNTAHVACWAEGCGVGWLGEERYRREVTP
jgi:hypothetical protein